MLYFLFLIHTAGSIEMLVETRGAPSMRAFTVEQPRLHSVLLRVLLHRLMRTSSQAALCAAFRVGMTAPAPVAPPPAATACRSLQSGSREAATKTQHRPSCFTFTARG